MGKLYAVDRAIDFVVPDQAQALQVAGADRRLLPIAGAGLYRRLKYIRYADDFALAFTGPKAEAEEIKRQIATFLREELSLHLSEEKTLITHARTNAARFLGYQITTLHSDAKHYTGSL
ncbi:MAG TPA: reverse transcriptase domain-containing protein [Ktedonobacteraceae bacterium]